MRDWWLDELAHAGREHLDAEYVAGYEVKAGFDPSADIDVLRRNGLNTASTIVDLGAGTGRFTVEAAPQCGRVIAVDVSPAMVAVLRERVAHLGLHNVTVVEAGFLTYEHTGAGPSLVVFSRNALRRSPISGRESRWRASPR
jgi:SAM-dependent methyltransferase